MKIRRFFGKDMREALKQVKDELGGDAVIMSNKKVANGVELVAAVDPSANSTTPPQITAKAKPAPTLSEVIGDDIPDSLQALLDKQTKTQDYGRPSPATQPSSAERQDARADESIIRSPAFAPDYQSDEVLEKSQAASLTPPPSVLEPDQLDVIKAELESIKNVLKFQVSELADERKKRHNPTHHYLHEQLLGMGLGPQLASQFVNFLPHNADEKQGWKYLLNLLSNRLHVGSNDILNQSGVVALVGPTGTGKTTTLAKLAAKYAQKYGADQVAMVTIDTYRIAAYEQLATYGRIIGCSVKKAQNAEELNQILYQMRNKKLVLIDTAGFSQRDARLIAQLNDYEAGLSVNIRKYLVLPAGAQYQVLNQTVKAYQGTDIQGCIFTKLDECYSLGEALSVVIENDLSLSYVTDGQRVPEDIKLADAANLTLVAAKLYKKYGLPSTSTEPVVLAGGV
ncbi:flagellar biosynthesis protein FlhF [Glaciecola sp. XM2]|jgi:flagellar biosynthesis protein FlhF|uniref:flagellar biosynthesis protein FlhF n=1 Tax=Glaciecola sp. XM2 TaxID=1914931 RepID=UPI001BDED08C|nr:flagellar biosynthesis protein FlhF [Glaciecola sp. XM2]MBT1450839.1 flagellar biosynthesis protein FlhF [Glaciecola sp. XM2]